MSDSEINASRTIALAKSAIVIPLVIAVVMGAGWGLIGLAAREQARSDEPDPKPVTRKEDGSFVLDRHFTEVRGEPGLWQGRHNPAQAIWQREMTCISWRFPVDRPGRYALQLKYTCDPADAGSTIEVQLAGSTLTATILGANSGKQETTLRVGEVDIPAAGWQELRITPVTIVHETVMNLLEVQLVRADSGHPKPTIPLSTDQHSR